ncbi:conserved membrane hypothetical protein [Mesorhizobium escarrei]|uniref:Uncharacterized protein n=1 Tax=Mesorhizobium escarrei TaxID=666018 RepID=A0ABM9EEX8_9HYPH|nr:conserved membrane hypothetical protein [Mesorhizobium escarrei]
MRVVPPGPALALLLTVEHGSLALGRTFAFGGRGLLALGGLLAGWGLLSCHRLFVDRLLAAFPGLIPGLVALRRSCLLVGRKRLALLAGFLPGWLFGWCGFDLLILLPLLSARFGLFVAGRCGLLGGPFGRCGFLLLLPVTLLPALFGLFVARRRGLLRGPFGRCGFLLLLPVALLSARFGLFVARRRGLLGGPFGRRGFLLLLPVTPLSARFGLFVAGRCGLLGGCGFLLLLPVTLLSARLFVAGRCGLLSGPFGGFLLLLLLAPLPALIALLLLAGRRGLFRGRRFGLPLALPARLLLRFRLLCAAFRRLAFRAVRLRGDQRRGGTLRWVERSAALQRECAQRRGRHQQAKCRACENPWLAFH